MSQKGLKCEFNLNKWSLKMESLKMLNLDYLSQSKPVIASYCLLSLAALCTVNQVQSMNSVAKMAAQAMQKPAASMAHKFRPEAGATNKLLPKVIATAGAGLGFAYATSTEQQPKAAAKQDQSAYATYAKLRQSIYTTCSKFGQSVYAAGVSNCSQVADATIAAVVKRSQVRQTSIEQIGPKGSEELAQPVLVDRPSNLMKDYPEFFDEFKFELVYAKWRQRLDAELDQILAEEGVSAEDQAIIKGFANQREDAIVQRPDLDSTESRALFAAVSAQKMPADKAAEVYALLDQYGVTDKRSVLLGDIDMQGILGVTTENMSTRNVLIGINLKYYERNISDMTCTVGHEGVHALCYDVKIDDFIAKKYKFINKYILGKSLEYKYRSFYEKRADFLTILSSHKPTYKIFVDCFHPRRQSSLYNHRNSKEALELLQDIVNCYAGGVPRDILCEKKISAELKKRDIVFAAQPFIPLFKHEIKKLIRPTIRVERRVQPTVVANLTWPMPTAGYNPLAILTAVSLVAAKKVPVYDSTKAMGQKLAIEKFSLVHHAMRSTVVDRR